MSSTIDGFPERSSRSRSPRGGWTRGRRGGKGGRGESRKLPEKARPLPRVPLRSLSLSEQVEGKWAWARVNQGGDWGALAICPWDPNNASRRETAQWWWHDVRATKSLRLGPQAWRRSRWGRAAGSGRAAHPGSGEAGVWGFGSDFESNTMIIQETRRAGGWPAAYGALDPRPASFARLYEPPPTPMPCAPSWSPSSSPRTQPPRPISWQWPVSGPRGRSSTTS